MFLILSNKVFLAIAGWDESRERGEALQVEAQNFLQVLQRLLQVHRQVRLPISLQKTRSG